MDFGVFLNRQPRGPLARLLCALLGQVAPDGGNGDDKLEGGALHETLAELLLEHVSQVLANAADVVGHELFHSTSAPGRGVVGDDAHGLKRGVKVQLEPLDDFLSRCMERNGKAPMAFLAVVPELRWHFVRRLGLSVGFGDGPMS